MCPHCPPGPVPVDVPTGAAASAHLFSLRHAPPEQLDPLLRAWMAALGLEDIRLSERRGSVVTYEAWLGETARIPVRVRLYERHRRLHVHHVEAFLGHLVRAGCPIGILATTGDATWSAELAARTPRTPFLRLCNGSEWIKELEGYKLLPCPCTLWYPPVVTPSPRRSSKCPVVEPQITR